MVARHAPVVSPNASRTVVSAVWNTKQIQIGYILFSIFGNSPKNNNKKKKKYIYMLIWEKNPPGGESIILDHH